MAIQAHDPAIMMPSWWKVRLPTMGFSDVTGTGLVWHSMSWNVFLTHQVLQRRVTCCVELHCDCSWAMDGVKRLLLYSVAKSSIFHGGLSEDGPQMVQELF